MSLVFGNYLIENVSIMDDDREVREGYEYTVEDLQLQPIHEPAGPRGSIEEFVAQMRERSQALLCDYRLKHRDYSDFDGDQIVAQCYRVRFPAILSTSYTDWDITLMRRSRRYIPVLIRPRDLNPETIFRGFRTCIDEFHDTFELSREPSRTLVRVAEVERERGYLYVIIPGWSPRDKIRVSFADISSVPPSHLTPGTRLHATVNVGADSASQIYIDDWEEGEQRDATN